MALDAPLRQQRPDLLAEVNSITRLLGTRAATQDQQQQSGRHELDAAGAHGFCSHCRSI
jgi:hypothetical protein